MPNSSANRESDHAATINQRLTITSRDSTALDMPASLRTQLAQFRKYVWVTKLLESIALGCAVWLLAFLTVYFLDRNFETPAWARWLILAMGIVVWIAVPLAIYRWLWLHRRSEQLARLLRRRQADIGGQMLSVIELSHNQTEQSRSPVLCQAAMAQVAQHAQQFDLRRWAPSHWLRQLLGLVAVCFVLIAGLALLFPAAAGNAMRRLAMPWKAIPRYTFASIDPLSPAIVVAHGEPSMLKVQLAKNSQWKPVRASMRLGSQPIQQTELDASAYSFDLPAQVDTNDLTIVVGDFYQQVQLQPQHRPELVELNAQIHYPGYLQQPDPFKLDIRSGTLSIVQGSTARLQAQVSQQLQSVTVADKSIKPSGANFESEPFDITAIESSLTLNWVSSDGLSSKQPFELKIQPLVDEPPSVVAQGLPKQAVVLDTEQINFTALAADDFGLKRLGLVWRTVEGALAAQPAEGERVIAAGSPGQTSQQVSATFCAAALGIAPQPIEVSLFAEDYLPDRPAVHSPTYLLYILTAEEHAIWIANQMNKWQQSALDVRDAEIQLHETNRALRQQAQPGLLAPELIEQLRRQAALEESNGRKLNALTMQGTELLRQAARNPDVAIRDLEQWAKMLEVLQEIGQSRMPVVADLLKQASQQSGRSLSTAGDPQNAKDAIQVGQNRATPSSESLAELDLENVSEKTELPGIADVESSMQGTQKNNQGAAQESKQPKPSDGRLSLPQTALLGPEQAGEEQPKQEQPQKPLSTDQLAEAVEKQRELLAEFEKIADELNAIMANLEGSTLVKRLKAASREQSMVAERIASRIDAVFGRASELDDSDRSMLTMLAESEQNCSKSLSYIMDDMQAFYERRQSEEFQSVLEEMNSSRVLTSLQELGQAIPGEHGLSISQAEYWADTIDRWAEDLVPANEGDKDEEKEKKESEAKESLPPRIILELLKVLEAEVNLREETRVAQQAQPAVTIAQHEAECRRLELLQQELKQRVDDTAGSIEQLPEATKNFESELQLLSGVSMAMDEARVLLRFGDVSARAIAAETEAIELLLQSQRINPKGSSGGTGTNPGGGGTGTTQESALTLIGSGINQLEKREQRDVGSAVGNSNNRDFPEEFRSGLDTYFHTLETQ